MEPTAKSSLLRYFSITKLFIGVITLLLVILAFVPQAIVLVPDEFPETQWWHQSYSWSDPIVRIIYVLFAALWVIFFFVKQQWLRKVIIASLLIVSFCWFVFSFAVLVLASQDVIPDIGIYISLLLFPCLISYLVYLRISKPKEATKNRDHIL